MKNNLILVVFTLIITFLGMMGCNNNQTSSIEEALYSIEHQPDFGNIIQIANISSGLSFPNRPEDPFISAAAPKIELKTGSKYEISYVAVYKTKDNNHKMVFLNDSRPPVIISEKKF